MGYYFTSIHLRASQEVTWAFLADLHRNEEWESNVQSVLLVTNGPVGLDTIFRKRLRIFGPFHAESEWRITHFKPPRLHEHLGNVPIIGLTRVRYALEPTKRGCLCRVEISYPARNGVLDTLLIRPRIACTFRRNLRRMKKLVDEPQEEK